MSAADDALAVARFCFPDQEWEATKIPGRARSGFDRFDAENREGIAAAERVLVERGMGEAYGRALERECRAVEELDALIRYAKRIRMAEWAVAATAPCDARLRALARVVREQQQKETK